MKKKVLLLLASLALVTTLAVNGTFASGVGEAINDLVGYFQDIFGGATVDTSALEVVLVTKDRAGKSTKDAKPLLYPAHYSCDTNDLSWATSEVEIRNQKFELWNNGISGIAEQFVSVQNTAVKDVYFLVAIAVKDNAVLKSNISPAKDYYNVEIDGKAIKINGKDYKMWVYLYTKELNASVVSDEICVQMALVKEANNAHMAELGQNFLQIKAVAIEADAFTKKVNDTDVPMTYEETFNAAIDWDNFNPFN